MLTSGWRKTCLLLSATLLATSAFAAEPGKITIKADQPGITVSPTLYGIFYEEINRAGDGGLYGEMLQNRSFEDTKREALSVKNSDRPGGWQLVKGEGADVSMSLDDSKPLNENNKHSLKVTITTPGKGAGVANVGFHNANDPKKDSSTTAKYDLENGIAVQKGKQYKLSLYARAEGDFKGPLSVSIQDKDGKTVAEGTIKSISADWKKYEVALKAKETAVDGTFVITATTAGTFYLDMVSLFPKDTFKNRTNGLRADLAQMVADMKPKFVRFPGGCFVEGAKLDYANRWKKTIGDIAERPGHWNMWGYWSNDGFGAYEFLQYCEDIQAEPLYVINVGMSHVEQNAKKDKPYNVNVDEYVQDALDFIEYANGPADSKWGALRAKAGHPKPFNLKYMEIGNENGGPIYNANYEKFRSAILEKSPKMRLIACDWMGTPKKELLDLVDEHYYNAPAFFFKQANKYDSYDRSRKVYVGEYAVTSQCGEGNLIAAVSEAAFMTGMERNSDVVEMCSYAPLFVNPAWKAWNPNAIVFDGARAYGTPSYHVQALFGNNRADVILPCEVSTSVEMPADPMSGSIGVGTWDTQAEYKDIKVTDSNGAVLFDITGADNLNGWKKGQGDWSMQNGVLKQNSNGQPALAILDGKKWGNCTVTMKARKIGGAEGFLISFNAKNADNRTWWNIGGWQNTQSALEWADAGDKKKELSVETNKWYDIKLEIKDQNVKCYLDGQLMHDETRKGVGKSLYAVSGRKKDTNEVIVKVVNGSAVPQETSVEITGAKEFKSGKAIVLAGENTSDENSFKEPTKIAPKEEKLEKVSDKFQRTFPPYSVTVLRLQEKK